MSQYPRICSNNRTIALIPHASKILLKILQRRIEPFVEMEMPDVQAGFRRGRGTRDQIANMRWMMEISREYQKEIYLCFIDYCKAFDCVDHIKLWNVLRSMGIPEHLILLLRDLYHEQQATVRTEDGETDWFKIGKGVRQGCNLSPYLFNLYTEYVMRLVLAQFHRGFRIGGRQISNLRYADDTTLVSESEDELKELIKLVEIESSKAGLKLNIKKTKIMTSASTNTFKIEDAQIEVVENFILLGSRIDKDGGCEEEIRRRLTLGRRAMTDLNKIMKDKDVCMTTKIRIVNTMVFPVVMYACESWTLRKKDRKKIDSFELWCWRRLLGVPWTARRTNESILNQIKPKLSLEAMILKQKLSYFGHVMRTENSIEKAIMLGKVEGARRRGRPKMRWMDGIKESTGMTLQELKEKVQERKCWRDYTYRVTRSRKRLDGF